MTCGTPALRQNRQGWGSVSRAPSTFKGCGALEKAKNMWGGISHYRKKWTKSITCSDSRIFQEAGMGCWEGGRLGRSGAPQAQVRVGCGVYPHGQWGAGICWHVGEVSRRAPQAVTENKQTHLSLSLADQLEFPPLCPVSSQALEPRPTSNIPVNPQPGQSPAYQVPPLQCPSLLLPPPHLLPTPPPRSPSQLQGPGHSPPPPRATCQSGD